MLGGLIGIAIAMLIRYWCDVFIFEGKSREVFHYTYFRMLFLAGLCYLTGVTIAWTP